MVTRSTGRFERRSIGDEDVSAFIPDPLPPDGPPITMDDRLRARVDSAEHALKRLDLAGDMVPSLDWFIYAFVRKEAVLSSQIEGTQATLVDLLAHEADPEPEPPGAEVEEICNYLDALAFARDQLASPTGLPLSTRLLNEAHRRLMSGVRGADKHPGEVRTTQNWIGGTRPGNASFVPPPPHALAEVLSALETYIHAEDNLPPLIRTGLLHAQFETIHPYLDGNGRIGRLLVALLLEHWGLLRRPLLYLSLFLKQHRAEYYHRLDAVRAVGDWEAWLAFFLDGIETVANESVTSAQTLFAVVAEDRAVVHARSESSLAAVRLFELLPRHPIVTIGASMAHLSVTRPTAGRAIEILESSGVLVESTGKKRGRSWAYQRYLDELRAGTELG